MKTERVFKQKIDEHHLQKLNIKRLFGHFSEIAGYHDSNARRNISKCLIKAAS